VPTQTEIEGYCRKMTEIACPEALRKIYQTPTHISYEVGAILRHDYDGVSQEFFDYFEQAKDVAHALELMAKRNDDLVAYRFYSPFYVPMYQLYADGKIHSSVPPKKFVKRAKLQGPAPWDFRPQDTFFEFYRWRKNKYYGETELRLRCGGRSKDLAKKNFALTRNFLTSLLNKI
jgi:hypothetical protein